MRRTGPLGAWFACLRHLHGERGLTRLTWSSSGSLLLSSKAILPEPFDVHAQLLVSVTNQMPLTAHRPSPSLTPESLAALQL